MGSMSRIKARCGLVYDDFIPYAKRLLWELEREEDPKEQEKYARLLSKIGEWDRQVEPWKYSEVKDE